MYETGDIQSRIPDWGYDARPEDRPGVPMEHEPRPMEGVHWREPIRQGDDPRHLKRMELDRLTPVYGTAVPPRGVSGRIRRFAYSIPEHRARRWMLLLFADRVDVVEYAVGTRARWLPVLAAAGGGAFVMRRIFRTPGRRPFETHRRHHEGGPEVPFIH